MPKKNVLAILSGVAAVVLGVVAVLARGDALPVLGATVAAVGALVWGVRTPPRRSALVVIAAAVGSGVLFFHFDNFWGLFVSAPRRSSGLVRVWSPSRHGRAVAIQARLRRRGLPRGRRCALAHSRRFLARGRRHRRHGGADWMAGTAVRSGAGRGPSPALPGVRQGTRRFRDRSGARFERWPSSRLYRRGRRSHSRQARPLCR